MHTNRRSKNSRAKIRVEMVRLRMGNEEKFQEMDLAGTIPRPGCEKRGEIVHIPDERRIHHQAGMAISRRLPLLLEQIFSKLQTRYGKRHRRRFKRQFLNFSKREAIPVSRNGCERQLRENKQKEELLLKVVVDVRKKRFPRSLMKLLCLKAEVDRPHGKQEPLNHDLLLQVRILHVINHQPCQNHRQKGVLRLSGSRRLQIHGLG
jgi:hypothetical protein